jgi:hypothetical protein
VGGLGPVTLSCTGFSNFLVRRPNDAVSGSFDSSDQDTSIARVSVAWQLIASLQSQQQQLQEVAQVRCSAVS